MKLLLTLKTELNFVKSDTALKEIFKVCKIFQFREFLGQGFLKDGNIGTSRDSNTRNLV